MDGNRKKQEESGPYIWLRYATQYTRDGRTNTVELSVPVPLGASAEERDQLFQEAETGLQQLATHMDQHVPPLASRSQNTQNAQHTARSTPQPVVTTKTAPAQATGPLRGNNSASPSNRPASMPAPQTATHTGSQPEAQPARLADTTRTGGNVVVPPSDPGTSMPLPQFIQYIKDNMDLTPKQAMELLNVRSLTTGLNLREALEQLKARVGQSGPSLQVQSHRRRDSDASSAYEPGDEETEYEPSGPLPRLLRPEVDSAIIEMRVPRPPAGFDEEIDVDDLDGSSRPTLEDLDDLSLSSDAFSEQELESARTKVSSLRESQGATVASPQRQQVLSNVVLHQITDEQLRALAEGVWSIQNTKKLKVDQVEALISWAKLEDDFIEQVEAVLAVLEEDHYARGNR